MLRLALATSLVIIAIPFPSEAQVPIYVDGEKTEVSTAEVKAIRIVTVDKNKPKPIDPGTGEPEAPYCDFYDIDCDGVLEFGCPGGEYDSTDYNTYYDTINDAYAACTGQ